LNILLLSVFLIKLLMKAKYKRGPFYSGVWNNT